jgi:type IV pilus assembly protein PilY1
VSQSALGVSTSAAQANLVNWAKGSDVQDENLSGSTTDRRLSAHGDVVHSRPVAVNFGSDASPQVAVFYGANDGWLRAVNGNRTADIGSVKAGDEMWAFMPAEFDSSIKRLYDNSTTISFPGSSGGSAKNYGMDGSIAAYKGAVGASTKTFLYATMRRGGRSIYAFDVTDTASSPSSPTFKWRIGCSASAECATNMTGIGQTWSAVQTFTHPNYGSGTSPLIIFGGGYDTCEDYDNGTKNSNCTSSSTGHYIYIRDGDTGAEVKTFDTGEQHGIIADVLVVPDSSGNPIYAYTADLGGNVYRVNLSGASSAWTLTKIASLGCADTSACNAVRKFMFVPSVVDNEDGTYTLYLGSGDREKPVSSYTASGTVANKFFSIVDKPTDATYPGTTYCGSAIICLSSLYEIAANANPTSSDLATKPQGWYLDLASTEQVVTSAITIFGVVTFSTHQPAVSVANSCSNNLGTTLVYNIDYLTGASQNGTANRFQDVAGDGLPPSAVGGQVTLDNGQTVPFCIGCSADSPLEAVKKSGGGVTSRPKSRLYWYIEK